MNYAITIPGSTHKLDVINLSDWEVLGKWDEFNTLRNDDDKNDIVLFPTKDEAIVFLLENFEREPLIIEFICSNKESCLFD